MKILRLAAGMLSVAAIAVPMVPGAASAQINGPAPMLMGQPSKHLYSVPGVIDSGGLRTFFACTNTISANIRVGVETFASVGGLGTNDPSSSSLDLGPGQTQIFGTQPAIGISVDSVLSGGPYSKGSARILATASKGIICTAFVADPANAPPTTSWQLTVVAKTKQKGD